MKFSCQSVKVLKVLLLFFLPVAAILFSVVPRVAGQATNEEPTTPKPTRGTPSGGTQANRPAASAPFPTSARESTITPVEQRLLTLPTSITFVQITDAHLFDGGKKRATKEEAVSEQNDGWEAFRWAVQQINTLSEGGTPIDFVVFTGDFGLDFVRVQGKEPCDQRDKDFDNEKSNGWLEFYTPVQAAEKLAHELQNLKVKTIYVVPGNNDLASENPCDLDRYKEFIKRTGDAMPKSAPRLVDLTTKTAQEGPFRLVGLNSASFKKMDNYKSTCSDDGTGAPPDRKRLPGCPRDEMESLAGALKEGSNSYLVFTHIPDLMDPKAVRDNPQECIPSAAFDPRPKCGSWELPHSDKFDLHKNWEELIENPLIVAVFAGHFHDAERANYAIAASETALYNGLGAARKTRVGPPLAVKYQYEKCPTCRTRGLLLVRVEKSSNSSGAVSAIPFWFTGAVHASNLTILWWVLSVAVLLTILIWIALSRSARIIAERIVSWFFSSPVLTVVGALAIYVITSKLLEFITSELSVPKFYYLVVLFGAIGGLIGSIFVEKEIVFCNFWSNKITLGLLADVIIGMGGSTAIAFIFDNPLHITDGNSSEMILLVSVSLIAGVIGRNLVQIASEKLLHRIADEAARKAVEEKVKSDKAANTTP